MPPRAPKTGEAAVQAVNEILLAYRQRMRNAVFNGAEALLVDTMKLHSVEEDGTVIFEIFLGPSFQHVGGALHGGMAAMILDQCTSLAIIPHARPGYWEFNGGVTRTFTVTCLRPCPRNTTIHVRCKVVSIGQTAVLVRGELCSQDEKTIFNVIDHNKMNVVLRKDEKGMVVKRDGPGQGQTKI